MLELLASDEHDASKEALVFIHQQSTDTRLVDNTQRLQALGSPWRLYDENPLSVRADDVARARKSSLKPTGFLFAYPRRKLPRGRFIKDAPP